MFGYELNLIVFYPPSVWTLYWLLLYSVSESKTDLLCYIIKNDFYVKSSLNVQNFIPYMVIWLKLQRSYPDWQGWFFVLGAFCKCYLQQFTYALRETIPWHKLFNQFNLIIQDVYWATDFRGLGIKWLNRTCFLLHN